MNVSYQNRLEQPQRRAADSKQKKTLGIAAWDNISGWLFISPMLIGFLLFMFGPLLFAFYISLTDWPLLGERAFAGLENYREIFGDPEFHQVLRNTIVFSGGLVPLNLALALSLALLMKDKIPGIGFFRTAIFVPVITSLVVWAIVWKFMFGPELGLINQMLGFIGIDGPNWLYDKRTGDARGHRNERIKKCGVEHDSVHRRPATGSEIAV